MPQDQYQRTFPFSRVPIMHPALLYDDGNGTWQWNETIFGAGPTFEYDPVAAYVGLNGIHLQTGATAPAEHQLIAIPRALWLPPHQRLRLQACFNLLAAAPAATLSFFLNWFTGEVQYVGGVQVQSDNAAVRYASALAAGTITWTAIAGWTCQNLDDCWNKLDFSIDLDALTYHRGNLNEQVMDASGIDIPFDDSILGKVLQVVILLETLAAAQATAYIDQFLLTAENP